MMHPHPRYTSNERCTADGGLGEEDDDENPEQRVKRRLAQNREAARKSRQRRKQYVAKLEEEVNLRRTLSAAVINRFEMCHTFAGGGWHRQYAAAPAVLVSFVR